MQINRQVLDKVFLPFFEKKSEGDEIRLVELNELYDYKQRLGALTKEEAEYVIITQISMGRLVTVTPSLFKISAQENPDTHYAISQEEISKAAKTYSDEFWEKYRELKNT